MSDVRKSIINIAGCYFGGGFPQETWEQNVTGLQNLDNFVNMGNLQTLFALKEKNEGSGPSLRLFTEISNGITQDKLVVFMKTKPGEIIDDGTLSTLQIFCFSGSPTLALYHTLSKGFSPLLKTENDGRIQRKMEALQADLHSTLVSKSIDLEGEQKSPREKLMLDLVQSLDQEVDYWNIMSTSKRDRLSRTASSSFREILKPLAQDFNVIEALPLNDVEDLLERSHNILDDLWRHEPPYPLDRIKHLMNIIAEEVCRTTLIHLKKHDIWHEEFNPVMELLQQLRGIASKWLRTCEDLTKIFWPNYSANPWKEDIYQPPDLVHLHNILQEVISIRTVHKQLLRLLSTEEQETLSLQNIFEPFKDIELFHYDSKLLRKAQKQFEYLLQPAEKQVAYKLKKQFNSISSNTSQLLYEFSRYSELISRPVLKESLQSERLFLLTNLFDHVRQIQTNTTLEYGGSMSNTYNTPQIIKDVTINRQLESNAKEILTVAQKVLDDLPSYNNLIQSIDEMIKELKNQHNELFEAWTSEIISYINNKSLSLKVSDPVVRFSNEKYMRVNFSPRLVGLISEVRQLKAFGYHVPNIINETSAQAKRFMRYARVLEQIANFHNTIGDRMIPSQQPMMLSSALELSKLVQEEEVVRWQDESSVEKYVNTLNTAVEKLSKENNLLTNYHKQIIDKINSVSEVDLIKNYSKWKECSKTIRSLITELVEKGFKNMDTWKNDINKRLCDVLEKQYVKSLDTLHLYLPEIHTDLIYRNSGLEFSPNEENLRKQYEQQLKKFLDIPSSYNGIVDVFEGNIFAAIITNNAEKLDVVNNHKEDLFKQLHSVIKHWQSWLQLEALDTSKLTTWQHWDLHFRASKTFGQEIAKLPSAEERVGCFVIGLVRLRSDLEAHNRSYWDQLVFSLKDSIAEDVVKLQNYVDPSTASLTRQPVTIDEVGESDVAHSNIMNQLSEMESTYEEMQNKAKTLSSWSREYVDSVNRIRGAWDRLQSLLENHQHIIAKQMETIKTTLHIEMENLFKEIQRFQAKVEESKPRPHSGQISDTSIKDLSKQLNNRKSRKEEWLLLLEKKDHLIATYSKFNIEVPEILLVDEVESQLKDGDESWSLFEQFQLELDNFTSEYWIVLRKKLYLFEEFLKKWQDQLKNANNEELLLRILQEINKYETIVPALKYVKGDDFTEKHWINTFNLLEMESKPVDQLVLNDFLTVSDAIEKNTKELQLICKKASSEIVVRQALSELDQWEIQAVFTFSPHKDSHNKEINLIKDYKESLNKIGDNQSLLQSIKNSADYDSFAERANLWETKLNNLDYFLTSLAQIQRKWIYLEPIFGGGTLDQEKSRFERIDRDFKHVLGFVAKDARVVNLCRYSNLRPVLDNMLDHLARCQNSLENFLIEKRNTFPRFMFLSDDDLLEVVGQSSKEQVIQTHLKKIFAGINSIILDSSGCSITKICSAQGEMVLLNNSIGINQPVEVWLNSLVKEMQLSLKDLLVNCLLEKPAPDPLKYPSQILCLAGNIQFTSRCEQAIRSMTLPPLLAKYKTQLTYYSSQDLDEKSEEVDVLELKLKDLLLDTIHHINILMDLLDNNTTKVEDWTWQKQLRYYSNSTGEVTVKMGTARLEYSYEYLGNATKLVRTPLTERCFLTLTQGLHLGMGGNPYGPAGTGKTESVKALGGLLGRQVLVFNCDEGVDASSMGRILSGLVRCGAWGCFDEFNRLDEATLSAVSMIIQPIQVALRQNQRVLTLLEKEVEINKHCGIFVTLNPAGGGYGGRNKLPNNLKQLFRPVVMTHPDHENIARSLLHCDGYHHADVIAIKLIEVFEIASKRLSKQQHYDWGLRAIRTILLGCGRALKQAKHKNKNLEQNDEFELVVKVLRMDTLSKLTFNDSIKFDRIVKNCFIGVAWDGMENDILEKALEESYQTLGYIVNKRQVNKCLELYQQLKQRMGVAIVGPPSCGKSAIRELLLTALLKIKKTIKQYAFDPKSMTRKQLLGHIDHDTKQWTDGVLTTYSLQVASEPQEVWSWITCDGDVDPEWIESLNSVLDDNRLLSLPSGWRIQFGTNVNFIFETHDLSHASPATISRMGIVFLSEEDLNVDFYIKRFLNKIHEDSKMVLEPLINDYFEKALEWIVNKGEVTIDCSKIALARTGLTQIENARSKAQFAVEMVNGLGQQLLYDFREFFAQQLFEWTRESAPPIPIKARYNFDRDMVDVYYTNANVIIDDVANGLTLVMTGQVAQVLDTLRKWLKSDNNFILIGPHGSAKTLILNHLINEETDMEMVTIHCTANLMPSFVINKLQQHCISINTHKGKVYKPKKGHLVLYFKNLHLLEKDKWGTNILIELLIQIIKYKGFYDSNTEFIGLENIKVVGSLSPVSNISVRFTSIVCFCNVSLPDREDLIIILTAYLYAILKKSTTNSSTWTKPKVTKLVGTMILIYDKIQSVFTNLVYKHYTFTPHDLIKWCSNIITYQTEDSSEDIEMFVIQIVCYEALRLFGDKLGTKEDLEQLMAIINDSFMTTWSKPSVLTSISDCYFIPDQQVSSIAREKILLNKFKKPEWVSIVEIGILHCDREGQMLNVLVTEELLHLTSSIAKCLITRRGHLLCIGKSGIGRRSSIKIVAALQSAKLIVPSTHTKVQFNNDLKMAMQYAAIDGETIYLQIEDHVLTIENNLNMISFLISSGEVPGLYTSVEFDSMVKNLKEESDRENFDGDLLQFFIERIRRNLHIIICLDVDNVNLWKILQTCPAFIEDTTVIWKTSWTTNTMKVLPKMLLQCEDNEEFLQVYLNLEEKYSAPLRYISMVRLYKLFYDEKMKSIATKQTKLDAGVAKLTEASNLVKELNENAKVQQVKLAEKQSKANVALDMISSTMKNASSHKEEMESLKSKTETENQQLKIRKKEIEKELAEVEPLIQEARSAVGNIRSESLSEIRSLRAPPEVIRDILEGVLRLMGIQDTSWNSMKTFLAKRGVKEDIRSFDATRITNENRKAVEKLVSTKSDSFDAKAAKRASIAAAPLAAWVMANVKYSYVLDKIRPLEKEQNKLQRNLHEAELQLGELSAGLSDVDVTVGKLKEKLSAYTKEAAAIEIDLNKAQETLGKAEGLVSQLNDEYTRWQEQLKEFSVQLLQLPKNCILSSAMATYLSGEPEDERERMMELWRKQINNGGEFNFEEFMTTEREQMQWQSEGLPSDKLSIQNAIVITMCNSIPLLIDPSSTAINWMKNHSKHRNMESVTFDSPKFQNVLELAVRFGKILFIEEIETISSTLLPILRRDFIYQGERKLVKLNGKLMDYHQDFKLILSSRNEDLTLPADIAPLVNLMNFTVTHVGLSEQLLSAAIRQENPELEARRKQLLREKEDLQEKHYQLQNQLLDDLSSSTGDILQNYSLMNSLNETKASSIAITKALKESNEIQTKLQSEYNVYKEISDFASSLYFACNEFSKYNVMYVLSVPSYTKIFLRSLQTFQDLDKSINTQKRHLFHTVYEYMSRGILKNDRLSFAMHLTNKMFMKKESQAEWNFFLGNYIVSTHKFEVDEVPSWLPKSYWYNIQQLQGVLPDLYKKLQLNDQNTWNNFMTSNDIVFPNNINLTEFQKLLIVQLLRPDKLWTNMMQFVYKITGLKTLNPTVLNMSQVFKESTHEEPILLLTTSGTDPSSEIRHLVESVLDKSQYVEIAMGEGQETVALNALQKASDLGQWLILKNLHLVTSWLTILSQRLKHLTPHTNFRLWLISENSKKFHSVLAQNCLKIVCESPEGLKNNITRSFSGFGHDYFSHLNTNSARIFFVLSYVHALMQERRKYIPQGWSKWYEFSDTDFSTCIKLVEDLWQNSSSQIQWKFISGLCTEAVYGGRIENTNDMKIMYSYIKEYINDQILSTRWKPVGTTLDLPNSSKYADYLNTINKFPSKDEPLHFGLPENIGRAWEKQTSTNIILNLKNLTQSDNALSSTFNREGFSKGLSNIMSLWKKLNHGRDFLRTQPTATTKDLSSIENFFSEEYCGALTMVQMIHKDFSSLNKVCKGALQPTENDLVLGNSLINFDTPQVWLKKWNGPTNANLYLRNIISKMCYLTELKEASVEEVIRKPLRLTSLFHPEALIASFKEEFAIKNNVSMDELVIETSWQAPKSHQVLILNELLMEGGLFDGYNLKPCLATSENINSVPNCFLTYVKKNTQITDKKLMAIPLYTNSSREIKLFSIDITTPEEHREKWIQSGLCFYLEL